MAIQQTKKQSDLEKRLQILRRQVYGKSSEDSERLRKPGHQSIRQADNSSILTFRSSGTSTPSETSRQASLNSSESFRTDLTYLRQDLTKILTFSSFAIGVQVILFFLLKNHILKINFF